MKGLYRIIAVALAVLLAALPAHALDPARRFGQYKHTRWTVDDGAPSFVASLAQGRDGFLWIGARDGLFRFDGISFEHIPSERGDGPGSGTSALLAASDGTIWAGRASGSIAVYRDGVLRDTALPNTGAQVISLVERPGDGVWALIGRLDSPLARYYRGRWQAIGENWGFPRDYVINAMASRDGTLWVATVHSIYFLNKGSTRFRSTGLKPAGHAALSEDREGNIWLSDLAGSRPIRNSAAGQQPPRGFAYRTPGFPGSTRAFFDSRGSLWGSTNGDGIFRLVSPKANGSAQIEAPDQVQILKAKDGLLSDVTNALIEDREGNIWIGSVLGLERLRDTSIAVEPALTELSEWGFHLLGASDGTVYVGQKNSVYRVKPGGQPALFAKISRETEALCEGSDGSVWIILQDRILRARGDALTTIDRPKTVGLGIVDCAVDRAGRLWLSGDQEDGLFVRTSGQWRRPAPPSKSVGPLIMLADRDRRIFVYYSDGSIVILDGEKRTVLTPRRAGALDRLYTMDQGRGGLMIGGAFGVARLRQTQLRFLPPGKFPLFASATGIVQTPEGDTWMISRAGIVKVSTEELERAFDDPRAPLHPTVFEWRDGLPGVRLAEGKHDAARGGDGRLWFSTTGGVVWVDPAQLVRNASPPPVIISAAAIDGVRTRDAKQLNLPAGTSSFQFDFAAPSLTIPQRVRVLYKLDGADRDWVDPGMRRQAFYTNLPPGHYAFRVIAANNDGVWNRTGATLEFDVPPTFLQSNWFIALCGAAAALLLWMAYRLRVRQLTARMRERLEQRLAERERIARDLHDTLLQGFQGLILRFQSVANEIPENLSAHRSIGQALDNADKILSDGRDSVKQLRTVDRADIVQILAEAAERMRVSYPVEFKMVVEGAPRSLHPLVRDEISRIGEEAIINAFQHAHASLIEVALSYETSGLTLGVRDDGIGIDPDVLARGGRQGHFGLVGMRERARQIGAEINVSSRPGGGTEIRLTIASKIAYTRVAKSTWHRWFAPNAIAEGGI